ncbi:ER lumen protein retaining receptor-domain-containing protein [Roridomyces roridus]|uniref:ER lumen protein retaining receptor-domain-containing protein n=1 Tax=Roridomyces roridus TaxID=1738132 RepID=A0AAD7F972_9AGAR|nr:ER lumen protein retaining receptor-domain-containing protein [Roridomyces roridus]
MNIFRLLGDLAHLLSKGILIWSIHSNKSAQGISFLTQGMYALVFLGRYTDLLHFISFYNTLLKIVYILTALYVLVLMQWVYPRTQEGPLAWRAAGISLGGSLVFALLFNYQFTLYEILWSFSIALESVCVIPQLILLRQTTVPTVITSYYLLALGSYRALYIPNWVWRYLFDNLVDPIAVTCGILQTAMYLDFARVYYGRQRIKLRGGVVVDSEDFERGWFTRWVSGKGEPEAEVGERARDEEGAIALPPDEDGQTVPPPVVHAETTPAA